MKQQRMYPSLQEIKRTGVVPNNLMDNIENFNLIIRPVLAKQEFTQAISLPENEIDVSESKPTESIIANPDITFIIKKNTSKITNLTFIMEMLFGQINKDRLNSIFPRVFDEDNTNIKSDKDSVENLFNV